MRLPFFSLPLVSWAWGLGGGIGLTGKVLEGVVIGTAGGFEIGTFFSWGRCWGLGCGRDVMFDVVALGLAMFL